MQNNPKKTGIIYLWDLPKNITYLDLEKNYKKELLETAKNLAGNKWNDLARKLKIPIPKDNGSTLIRIFRKGSLTSLHFIKKLSKFLIENNKNKFSLENIQKNIIYLSVKRGKHKILDPKFPMNFNSKEGATIISCLYHDGGIDVRDKAPFYSNISKELRERFFKSINLTIGKIGVTSIKKYNYKEVCCPKIIGIILITLGLVPGRRPINNPKFPEFVFKYNSELIYEFLSQAIADDGWIYCPSNKFGFISMNFTIDLTKFPEEFRQKVKKEKIEEHIPNILLGNKKLFEKIGSKVEGPYFKTEWRYNKNNKLVKYTQEWQINIRDWWSVKFLSKKLKIPLEYKQEKLKEIAKKERSVIRCNPKLLKIIGKLRSGFVCNDILRKDNSHNNRTIRYQLKCFCEDEFLKRVRFSGGRDAQFKYFLTNKGKEKLNLLGTKNEKIHENML